MSILSSLINGIFIGVGVILGILICFAYVIAKIGKQPKYDPNELVLAFEKYATKIIREEWYEQRDEVLLIIESLKNGFIPPDVDMYVIKKDISVQAENKSDITTFKVKKSYTIVEKKSTTNA